MIRAVDRALVQHLLEDETLSYREVARQAGCSDWSVRAIVRDLSGDARPMKHPAYRSESLAQEPAGILAWGIFAGFVSLFILAFVVAARCRQSPQP